MFEGQVPDEVINPEKKPQGMGSIERRLVEAKQEELRKLQEEISKSVTIDPKKFARAKELRDQLFGVK